MGIGAAEEASGPEPQMWADPGAWAAHSAGPAAAEQDPEGFGGGFSVDVTDGLLDFVADPRVEAWLTELGLEKYAEIFTKAEVDMDALRLMGDEDLLELGVTALGPRKKMLATIQTGG